MPIDYSAVNLVKGENPIYPGSPWSCTLRITSEDDMSGELASNWRIRIDEKRRGGTPALLSVATVLSVVSSTVIDVTFDISDTSAIKIKPDPWDTNKIEKTLYVDIQHLESGDWFYKAGLNGTVLVVYGVGS